MARRATLQSSLFPFLSVLACTIGALSLLLVALALSSVGATRLAIEGEEALASERAGQYDTLEESIEALEREWETLQETESRLAELDALLTEAGLEAGRSLTGIREELDQRDRAGKLQRELARVDARMARLEKERGKVETSIAVVASRRETLPILIDPTGLSRRQKPYFVECDAEGATAYRVKDDFTYFVPYASLSTAGEFGRYLRRVRATPGALLVALVREDGIKTANRIERLSKEAGIRFSKLPLPGGGPLDFRLMRRSEEAR